MLITIFSWFLVLGRLKRIMVVTAVGSNRAVKFIRL